VPGLVLALAVLAVLAWVSRRRREREPFEFMELATYNSEVARGLLHTPEWKAKMAAEQERFNRWRDERFGT
jgi:hypothetical protein